MTDGAREWILGLAPGASVRNIAENAGVAPSTLARQQKEGNFQPRTLVQIARHYKKSPLEGLLALGLLTETDVARMEISLALQAASDRELVKEVIERIRKNPESDLNQPLGDVG